MIKFHKRAELKPLNPLVFSTKSPMLSSEIQNNQRFPRWSYSCVRVHPEEVYLKYLGTIQAEGKKNLPGVNKMH